MSWDGERDRRLCSVAVLRRLLAELPDDALVGPNLVGNLTVLQPVADGRYQYIGFIDIPGERLERLDDLP